MKPAAFKYYAPASEAEALALLAEYGDEATVLAGGQSLVPAMNFRLARPSVLVDINGIGALAHITRTGEGELRLGAMTRQRTVERSDLVAAHAPLLHETMPFIAHPPIRNRGTVGGTLAHADPAAELPAVMVALDARFRLTSERGNRWVAAPDFFHSFFTTARDSDELLTEIALPPLPDRYGCAFREVARRHGDYALVGAAAAVKYDAKGRCQYARLVFLSVGEGPVSATSAAGLLAGEVPTPGALRAAAESAATQDIDPGSDIHASAAYRRHLARVLAEGVLTRAFACAEAS